MSFVKDLLIRGNRNGFPAKKEHIQLVLDQFREQTVIQLRPEGMRLLDSIQKHTSLEDVKEEELPLLARYLNAHTVLCYRNGEGWFEIHPLVQEHVARLMR